jgi:hypothetical protein
MMEQGVAGDEESDRDSDALATDGGVDAQRSSDATTDGGETR